MEALLLSKKCQVCFTIWLCAAQIVSLGHIIFSCCPDLLIALILPCHTLIDNINQPFFSSAPFLSHAFFKWPRGCTGGGWRGDNLKGSLEPMILVRFDMFLLNIFFKTQIVNQRFRGFSTTSKLLSAHFVLIALRGAFHTQVTTQNVKLTLWIGRCIWNGVLWRYAVWYDWRAI